MAKIRKRRLRWTKSSAPQIVGYKLYWSENGEVNYDSKCVMLGNVTEIVLPDDVNSFKPNGGPIEFGLTATDEIGNESDMVTLKAPYQFAVPEAPTDLYLRKLDDYCITCNRSNESDEEEVIELTETVETDNSFKSKQFKNDLEIFDDIRMKAGSTTIRETSGLNFRQFSAYGRKNKGTPEH